jgi:MFS family permease
MSGTSQKVPNRALITLCVMMGNLMQSLDASIANVSLPYMHGTLSTSAEEITWVLTSYVIAAAIMTAPVGWMAVRFGRKNLHVACMSGFVVASMLCGMADTLQQMVAFRFLQGMCGAALVPLSQATMLDIYPFERRAQAMAIFGMGVMVGPITGPTLGGYLTEMYNWRYVFYVNVPFGVLAVIGLLVFLPKAAPRSELRFDWTGFAVLAMGVGALQLMLDRGSTLDWFSSREIIVEAVLAGLGLYLFVVHMFTAERPFLPPGLFKDRNFVCGVSMVFCTATVMLASSADGAIPGEPGRIPSGDRRIVDGATRDRHDRRHAVGKPAVQSGRSPQADGVRVADAGLRAVLHELLDAGCVAGAHGHDVRHAGLRHRVRVQSDDRDGIHHAASCIARLCHIIAVAEPQHRAGGRRLGNVADAGAEHPGISCRHRVGHHAVRSRAAGRGWRVSDAGSYDTPWRGDAGSDDQSPGADHRFQQRLSHDDVRGGAASAVAAGDAQT